MEIKVYKHELDYLNIFPENEDDNLTFGQIEYICRKFGIIGNYIDEWDYIDSGDLILYCNPID